MKKSELKKCIVCRELKENFTQEHVFSATIGGAFVIDTVCQECNRNLGNAIDNKLARSPNVLVFRKQFQIMRISKTGTRNKIPNPLKGKHLDEAGNEYIITYNEQNEPRAKLIPRMEEKFCPNKGTYYTISMAKEDFINEDVVKSKIEKKYNVDLSQVKIEIEEKKDENPISFRNSFQNRIMILGALKAAYELTCTLFPNYLLDPYSIEYSEILRTGHISKLKENLFDEDLSLRSELVSKIISILGIQLYHHVAVLVYIESKGFYCLIKIFDFVYLIKMTSNDNLKLNKEIILINDASKQEYQLVIPIISEKYQINVELGKLKERHKNIIERQGYKAFENGLGKIPIYDKTGKKIFDHIDGLKSLQIRQENDFENSELIIISEVANNEYFLGLKGENVLIPLIGGEQLFILKY